MQAKFSPAGHRIWILDHEISLFAQYIQVIEFKKYEIRSYYFTHISFFRATLLFENIAGSLYQEIASQNRQVCALFFNVK